MELRLIQILVGVFFVLALGRSASIPPVGNPLHGQIAQENSTGPFTLEETYQGRFKTNSVNNTWITDTKILYIDSRSKGIVDFDIVTSEKTVLLEADDLLPYKYQSIRYSHDGCYLLIGYNRVDGFRYAKNQKYVVYDVKRKAFYLIANGAILTATLWSPISNDLIYVHNNDIYYMKFDGKKIKTVQLTDTGKSTILNGVTDWVYQEEVMMSEKAMWFSPDGRYLAFATFNDTQVNNAAYFYYGEPGSLKYQYPWLKEIRYPKAGRTNPVVTLSVVDLKDPSYKLVNLPAPVDAVGEDHILGDVSWFDEQHVVGSWLNRVQNVSQLVLYDTQGVGQNVLYVEETEGWIDTFRPIYHDRYVLFLKLQESGTKAGRFYHVTRYEYENRKFVRETDLTPGPSEVIRILALDGKRGKLFYTATAPDQPQQRNMYSVPLNGSEKPTCISCGILTPEGNRCTYVDASFSSSQSYYVLHCFGPDPATSNIYDANHNLVHRWNNQSEIRAKLKYKLHPVVKHLAVRVNGYDSKVRLFLPPGFDEKKSYPMLVNVYAGPNSQRITDMSSYEYQYYLTTSRNVIYANIDGRGSSRKGSKMLFEIYRRLGTVEVKDQIDVTKYLQDTYPWIDRNRTAIWGWSYGGYTTGMVLATDNSNVFKCGISVAPVSSWIYYDSVYTERYMGLPTPADNLQSYKDGDLTSRVEGLRGKSYMVVHGTADDNVHYQQALTLIKALEEMDIQFEQVSYTDEAHSLSRVHPHLYHTMDNFWGDCFGWPHTY